jgi:hypothetical protein
MTAMMANPKKRPYQPALGGGMSIQEYNTRKKYADMGFSERMVDFFYGAEKASYRQETKEEQELEKLYNMSCQYIENVILHSNVANGAASLYGDWHTIQDELLLDDTQKGKDYVNAIYGKTTQHSI